jgi:hypothetical protein
LATIHYRVSFSKLDSIRIENWLRIISNDSPDAKIEDLFGELLQKM